MPMDYKFCETVPQRQRSNILHGWRAISRFIPTHKSRGEMPACGISNPKLQATSRRISFALMFSPPTKSSCLFSTGKLFRGCPGHNGWIRWERPLASADQCNQLESLTREVEAAGNNLLPCNIYLTMQEYFHIAIHASGTIDKG